MKAFLISLNFRSANVCFTFALLLYLFFSSSIGNAQDVAALNAANKSVTYDQAISKYKFLDEKYPQAKLIEMGMTDIGRPLHLFVISSDEKFSPEEAKKSGKLVFLINNAIHPGEPDGVDACIRYSERILADKKALPSNVVILIIPFYNIDGAMKRGCCSRANQNGPEAYGFRGNARNLDLNRDFIKCDSENAASFTSLFRAWDPDVFLDTHVSDGSDYQYTMTLISTQHNKLGGPAGKFARRDLGAVGLSVPTALGFPGETARDRGEIDALPHARLTLAERVFEPAEERLPGGPRERPTEAPLPRPRRLTEQEDGRHHGRAVHHGAHHVRAGFAPVELGVERDQAIFRPYHRRLASLVDPGGRKKLSRS